MGFTDKDKWVVVCVTPIGESIEGEYSTQAEALQMQIALKLNNPQGVYDVKVEKVYSM